MDIEKTNAVFTDFDAHIEDIEHQLEIVIEPIVRQLKIPYLMDLNNINVNVECSREFGSQLKSYHLSKVTLGLRIERF
jgi:hypothetical protein